MPYIFFIFSYRNKRLAYVWGKPDVLSLNKIFQNFLLRIYVQPKAWISLDLELMYLKRRIFHWITKFNLQEQISSKQITSIS